MASPLRDLDEAWIHDYCARHGLRDPLEATSFSVTIPAPARRETAPSPEPQARGSRPWPKTELRRAALFEAWKHAGALVTYWHEPIRLVLAGKTTTYTPDFLLQYRDSPLLVFEEVKGPYIREDAIVKLKVAARLYPIFRFRLAQWKQGAWHERDITDNA